MKGHCHRLVLLFLFVGWGIVTAAEVAVIPPLFCPEAQQAPLLDGNLDDMVWQTAPTCFLVRSDGSAPLNPSWVKTLWRNEVLYLAFQAYDPDIVAQYDKHDARLWERDDVFEVFFTSARPGVRRMELQVNPRGVITDLLLREGDAVEQSLLWDWPGLAAECRIQPAVNGCSSGWSAELRLLAAGAENWATAGM